MTARRLIRALATAVLLALPGVAHPQYWATHEVCTADAPALHDDLFDPIGLAEAQRRAAHVPNGVGKFWQIETPGGAKSHLYGTYHVSDPRVLNLHATVLGAIRSARVVATEIDMIAPSRRVLEHRWTWPGYRRNARAVWELSDLELGPDVDDWIRSRTHGLGWGRDAADSMTLGGLAHVLLGHPCGDFTNGIWPILDDFITLQAQMAGVAIRGLEPFDAFVTHLNAPENKETARAGIAVLGAYLQPAADNDGAELGLELYQSGRLALWDQADLAYLTTVYGEKEAQHISALWEDHILTARNRTFVTSAIPLLDDGSAFLAVGAAHLRGPDGMVEMLRAQGYTVTRIPLPGEAQ